ncbi:hypothetical protein FOPG_16935 [Fusarium oxysporum f. sp. conglutinans race 2 54008]|uniref:Alpha/beta hydrolase fold-3 domain-containing protein n=3 Tax=Fusarium oxysporum f. sp. conglutinans TaxID=100902 RepID=A0A8H6LGT6_FUSOX|nr:hypothetical protein FOXB_15808 [Fusarium oxysporum f. sp. conglutinans Fo5176]EXL66920.1 hypothetical protein FOPG_16935 [Fusarium oxysporum f. sp. conglutinans race 2 54008]KAF6518506.1 hypothetical protein HZS61_002584 [Fusarium oxysporum f. sp. conglutinans]KAG6990685.1 Carboxylesterase NlhH [Fusarium oxysporum f. sp. conglutinans]KAI8406598.1 hypothetical protein FOFC_14068 [Fusarium oxysporum]
MSATEQPIPSVASSGAVLRPPYDPGLMAGMEAYRATLPEALHLESLRSITAQYTLSKVLESHPHLTHTEYHTPGLNPGDPEVTLSVFTSKNPSTKNLPALYNVHGGGQVAGDRFMALGAVMDYFDGLDVVFVSVEYRLAPEHPAPSALHDAYAGLVWVADHASELNIDASKIILLGASGGAPIAAGSAMLCRNDKRAFPCALMLLAPMLDDRDCTMSSKQFARDGPWCGTTNRMAWEYVLGSKCGAPAVSELVSPARATDLAGLPFTYIDVGECEVFRDEAVAFASQLWKSGVSAELHVWPGAYHGFDILGVDNPPVTLAAKATKRSWIRKILGASNV